MSKVNGCVIQHSEKILIKSKVGCSFSEISNLKKTTICVDMFFFNSTLNFGIPPALSIALCRCIINEAEMFVENFMIFYFLFPLTPFSG